MSSAGLVVIAPYSPEWPKKFASEKKELLSAFLPDHVNVEHVGSTAVPGLGAKPIVDIMLGATSLTVIERRIEDLAAIGYRYVPEFESVLPQRRYFVKPAIGPANFHLHAVETGSPFWVDDLAFRDSLRNDAALARAYLALKQQLAARFGDDPDGYTVAKASFIRGVLDAR
jgi:GrpB-like predicted nucleotidyltransferase (UPF0157 family)